MPPEWVWPFDDLLQEWFEEVNKARAGGYSMGDMKPADEMGEG